MSKTSTEEKDVGLYEDDVPQRLEDVIPKLEKPWFRYPYLVKLNVLLLSGILSQVISGFDGSMMNSLQSLEVWNDYFDHPSGHRLGLLSIGINVGTLVSVPFTSPICEYLGRRWSIMISCGVIIIGAILQGSANSFNMFLGARILLGAGASLGTVGSASFLAEVAYPRHRPTLTSLMQATWSLGSFIAAVVTWGPANSSLNKTNTSWRLPSYLQAVLPVVQLTLAFFGPESPRWLIARGKSEQALNIFAKYHAGGDRNSPLVRFQMAEITATVEAEALQKQSRWIEWFRSKAMLRRLFIVMAFPAMQQLCGNSIISYYFHIVLNSIGITDSITQLGLNVGLTGVGTVFALVCASFVYRFPRKWMIYAGYGSMNIIYVIFTILSALIVKGNYEDKGMAIGIVFILYCYQAAYHISSPLAVTLSTEVTTYSLRAKGQTLYQMSGNAVSTAFNYINPIALDKIAWKYYIVYDVWLFIQILIVYFIFPETYGKSLEEVAECFGDSVIDTRQTFKAAAEDMKSGGQVEHVERA